MKISYQSKFIEINSLDDDHLFLDSLVDGVSELFDENLLEFNYRLEKEVMRLSMMQPKYKSNVKSTRSRVIKLNGVEKELDLNFEFHSKAYFLFQILLLGKEAATKSEGLIVS